MKHQDGDNSTTEKYLLPFFLFSVALWRVLGFITSPGQRMVEIDADREVHACEI